jgi:hypothetical protein
VVVLYSIVLHSLRGYNSLRRQFAFGKLRREDKIENNKRTFFSPWLEPKGAISEKGGMGKRGGERGIT